MRTYPHRNPWACWFPAALHVAFAVELGAFGLAVGANIHSLSAGSTQHRHLLLLSLGIWPVITALPAFRVAFGTNMVLARVVAWHPGSFRWAPIRIADITGRVDRMVELSRDARLT